MKLIDIEDEVLWKNLSEGRRSAKQVVKLFMKQPVIEAIPISWIEKKIAKSKEYPNSDDISECYSLQISEVWGWLLEDWKEENGKQEKK